MKLEPHLPGQDEAFEGQPMLKEYYHKIEPTASRLSHVSGKSVNLTKQALEKNALANSGQGSQSGFKGLKTDKSNQSFLRQDQKSSLGGQKS